MPGVVLFRTRAIEPAAEQSPSPLLRVD
jgi:hypothetical protein